MDMWPYRCRDCGTGRAWPDDSEPPGRVICGSCGGVCDATAGELRRIKRAERAFYGGRTKGTKPTLPKSWGS